MKIGRTMLLTVVFALLGTGAYAADCNNGGRYEDISDGTVQDCRTGLIWLKDANCTNSLGLAGIDKSNGYLTWYDAQTWVKALSDGYCGLTDGSYSGEWRLPSIIEWRAMIAGAKKKGFVNPMLTNAAGSAKWTANGDAFNNVQSNGIGYWASTTYAPSAAFAFYVNMDGGFVNGFSKSNSFYVWPVRGGQSGSFGNLEID